MDQRVGEEEILAPLNATPWAGTIALDELGFDARRLVAAMFWCSGLLSAAGLVVTMIDTQTSWPARQFDLDVENNLPTWFSTVQLFVAAVVAGVCGAAHRARAIRGRASWNLIGAALLFVSFDEASGVHEWLSDRLRDRFDTGGALMHVWVVPYGVAVVVLGLCLVGFWRSLPATTRRRVTWSAVMFLGGAVGLEILEGLYETWRSQDAGLRVIRLFQESLEMFAVSLFISAQVRHLREVLSSPRQASGVRGGGIASGPHQAIG